MPAADKRLYLSSLYRGTRVRTVVAFDCHSTRQAVLSLSRGGGGAPSFREIAQAFGRLHSPQNSLIAPFQVARALYNMSVNMTNTVYITNHVSNFFLFFTIIFLSSYASLHINYASDCYFMIIVCNCTREKLAYVRACTTMFIYN